jgi:arylsulfatase A-like enzyme
VPPHVLRHELPARVGAILAIAQCLALVGQSVGHDPAGHPLQVSPINALMLQVPMYLYVVCILVAVWYAASALAIRGRRLVDAAGAITAVVMLFVVVVDLGMQRFRGERLSLGHIATYGSGSVLNSDWILPVLDARGPLLGNVVLLLGGIALIVRAWISAAGQPTPHPVRRAAMASVLAGLLWWPPQFAYYHQRDMARSPVSVLTDEWLHPRPPLDPVEAQRVRDELRAQLSQARIGGWLDDRYPLWRAGRPSPSPSFGAAAAAPPDIVLFVIESLRGRDVGWGFGPRRGNTPHLDSLAHAGVTFPHYIASGEPSPRGFISIHSGVWDHGQLFIVANRPEVALDELPLRLRRHGYWTEALYGANPSFDNQLTWTRRSYNHVVFEEHGNALFYFRNTPDRELMDAALARIGEHDRQRAGQPLFLYVASNGTHTPFELEAGAAVAPDNPVSEDRQRRYDLALRNVDAQIARVVAALRARARWTNTVIIVVGDHSDRTNEPADPRWRGMPTDAQVATAALFHGPAALVGRPRALDFTASHVDLMPTLLSWLGDTTASAMMGRDLFDSTAIGARAAVTVNSRGYRLDRGGFTLMVDSRDPTIFGAWRSFTGEQPETLPLKETPFAADEPARLHARLQYWSALVDRNLVRPPTR